MLCSQYGHDPSWWHVHRRFATLLRIPNLSFHFNNIRRPLVNTSLCNPFLCAHHSYVGCSSMGLEGRQIIFAQYQIGSCIPHVQIFPVPDRRVHFEDQFPRHDGTREYGARGWHEEMTNKRVREIQVYKIQVPVVVAYRKHFEPEKRTDE